MLLDQLWPAPADWRDLLRTYEPQRVAALMILRGNMATGPHPDRYCGQTAAFWDLHYRRGIAAIQKVLLDLTVDAALKPLIVAFERELGVPEVCIPDSPDHFKQLAIGRAHRRTLNHPFSLTALDNIRLKYLVALGWGTDPRVPDNLPFGVLEYSLNRGHGRKFWHAVKVEAGTAKILTNIEHPTQEAALVEVTMLTQLHLKMLDERKAKGTKPPSQAWKWQRPPVPHGSTRTSQRTPNSKGRRLEELMERFGIRGIEFGNWVPQAERQENIDFCYDALDDLVHVVGLPDKFASLGGRLGFAFGSRGVGLSEAAAHFEPGKWVVHLARKNGAGKIGHEFGHALDHFIAERNWHPSKTGYRLPSYASEVGAMGAAHGLSVKSSDQKVLQGFRGWWESHALCLSDQGHAGPSALLHDARLMDQKSKKKAQYWSTPAEMFARGFEAYLHDSLALQGGHNDYLVYGVDEDRQIERHRAMLPALYPHGAERSSSRNTIAGILTACVTAWTENTRPTPTIPSVQENNTMNESTSKFKFSSNKASIDQALAHLVEQARKIKREDREKIADAIHATAMHFDVDEGVLNEAWGNTAPQAFLN